MLTIKEFLIALKSGQLIYVNIAMFFVCISCGVAIIMEKSDYLYETLESKFGFDMVSAAKLVFSSIGCLFIALINDFILDKTFAIVASIITTIIFLILISYIRELPIWEEED